MFRIAAPFSLSLFWAAFGGAAAFGQSGREADLERFEKRIRPVLVERCFDCHSAAAKELRGGLRLDRPAGLTAGGDSGPVVIPGDPEASRLIQAIRQVDPGLSMPPDGKLADEEIAAFVEWVENGAFDPREEAQGDSAVADADRTGDRDEARWAFRPLERIPPPVGDSVSSSELIESGQVSSNPAPIDSFLMERLRTQGIPCADEADKPTLLRRACFDLLGLPPTPEELAEFLADDSPTAFEKQVDRMLASPQHGELGARQWLDLVRYTDEFEESWRYRDWVTFASAFDLPYDEFIRRQIAGDLIADEPDAPLTFANLTATTMLSIGQWSGIDRKKRLTDIVDDQIDTISRSFLGITLACARCHNHKFDPLTTADYYGLAGMFMSSHIFSDLAYLSHGTHRLKVPLVSSDRVAEHERQAARIHEAEARLEMAVDQAYRELARALSARVADYLTAAWRHSRRASDANTPSLEDLTKSQDLRSFAIERWASYLKESPRVERAPLTMAVRDYDGEPGILAWRASAERPWWAFNDTPNPTAIETFLLPARSLSVNPGTEGGAVGWRSPLAGEVAISGRLMDDDPFDGAGVAWILDLVRGAEVVELSSGVAPNGSQRELSCGHTPERLNRIRVSPGDMLYLQVWLAQGDAHYDVTQVELLVQEIDGPGEWNLVEDVSTDFLASNPRPDRSGTPGVWWFADMHGGARRQTMPSADAALAELRAIWLSNESPEASETEVRLAAERFQAAVQREGPLGAIAHDLVGPRSPFRTPARDDAQYLSTEAKDALAELQGQLEAIKRELTPLPCAHAIQEGGSRYSLYPGVQDVPIHPRGSYDRLGAPTPRRFPAALAWAPEPTTFTGSGRRELADWIASPRNPLTARVIANRIWRRHFGEGIVRTPSNLGAKGERPSHPELLDYLAQRLIDLGWSLKSLRREIMLSDAYRRSSRASEAALRADPENRLFGRMNRRRLEAEPLRDGLLAVAGRLDRRIGGPADADRDSPRRMLYSRTTRSDRSGWGAVFDAANPGIHVEKRDDSIVAPQALFLMNHPLVVDLARRLVEREDVANLAGEDRARRMVRLIFARDPTPLELELGLAAVAEAEKNGIAKDESGASTKNEPTDASPNARRATPWEIYSQAMLMSNEFLFLD